MGNLDEHIWMKNRNNAQYKTMSSVTADTLTGCLKVLGLCAGVKVDSRLGPALTNQGLV